MNGGILRFTKLVSGSGPINLGSAATVASGATLQLIGLSSTTTTIAAPISLTGNGTTNSLEMPSGNTQTYNFNGGISVTNGAIIRTFGLINTYNFNQPITGDASAFGLVINAFGGNSTNQPHTFVFGAASTYTGNTTLQSGSQQATLKLGVANALPVTTILNLIGTAADVDDIATLDLNGKNQTLAGITGTAISASPIVGGSRVFNATAAAAATLTINNAASMTMAGNLGATGGNNFSLSKSGGGTFTVSGTNTYTGSTAISAGTLQAAKVVSLPGQTTLHKISVGNGGTLALNVGGTGEFASTNVDNVLINADFNATSALGLDTTNATSGFTYGTVISDTTGVAGSLGITKLGTNTLTLTGANTYTGPTTVAAGTLALSGAGTLGNAAALNMTGGALDLGTSAQTVGAVSITAAASSGDTILNGSLTGTSYAASNVTGNAIVSADLLANGSAGLAKSGVGTLTLSGANTYTGVTNIAGGTLSVSSIGDGGVASSNLGSASNAAANLVIGAGATLQYTGATASTDRNFTLGGGSTAVDTIDVSTSGTVLTMTGKALTSTGSLVKVGAGTLELDPGVGNAYTLGSVTANGGTLILKSGTFNTTGIDPAVTAYTVGAGARGGNLTIDGATLAVGGGRQLKVGAAINGSSFNVLSGAVTSGDLVIGHNGAATGTQSGGSVTVTNLFHQDSGSGSYTLTGGTLTVKRIFDSTASANDFTLNLNGGTLKSATGTTNLIDNDGVTGNDVTVLLGAGNTTIDTTNSSATIVRPMGDMASQAGTFTKAGVNALTLTGANTYTGGTTISSGTVLANNSTGSALGSGSVTVASGATLGGAGTVDVTGSNTITINGALVVGNVGDTTGADLDLKTGTGGTTLSAGSSVNLDVFSGAGNLGALSAADADQLRLFGGVFSIDPTATLKLSNPNGILGTSWKSGDTFKLFDWSGLSSGLPSGTFASVDYSALNLPVGWSLDTTNLYTAAGTVSILDVAPEPTRVLLLGFGLICFAMRRRR